MARPFRLLIDTCVWLDAAKDYRQAAMLDALGKLVHDGRLEVILPRVVIDEFERNKSRVIEDAGRSISTTIRRARELVAWLGDGEAKEATIDQLNEVEFRRSRLRDAAIESLAQIESIFVRSGVVETSKSALLGAAQRAMLGLAPFHRQRNGIADAVIFETYLEALKARDHAGFRFGFVTHNIKDFSTPGGDNRLPHPDLAPHFTKVKSLYFASLGDALRRAHPDEVEDAVFEREWQEDTRGISEIDDALSELVDKLWYGRHGALADAVKEARTPIVEPGTEIDYRVFPRPVHRDIWEASEKAARRVEQQYGLDALGPWDDFEWGMISGKVSALRWVLGCDWDMLDT